MQQKLSVWPWAETMNQDSSKILTFSNNNKGLAFTYSLHKSAPYAGVTLSPKEQELWDISEYDYLEITFDTANSSSVQLVFSYFLEGFSDITRWQTLRVADREIHDSDESVFHIPFKQLGTPIWWFRENNVQSTDVPVIDYRKLANFAFVNSENLALGEKHSVHISSLRFCKDPAIASLLLWKLCGGYILVLLVVFLMQKKAIALPPMKRVSLSNHADEEYGRLSAFMGQHFTEKNLTVRMVAEQVGLTTQKITTLLQSNRSQTYSQFLNSLRLDEAKRLLRETDRNVSEIAPRVGYGYVNSFNRVFKEVEGKTPLEYRNSI